MTTYSRDDEIMSAMCAGNSINCLLCGWRLPLELNRLFSADAGLLTMIIVITAFTTDYYGEITTIAILSYVTFFKLIITTAEKLAVIRAIATVSYYRQFVHY